jgi:hypothetical protein
METSHLAVGNLVHSVGGGQTLPEVRGGLRRKSRHPTLAEGHHEVFHLSRRDHLAAQERK